MTEQEFDDLVKQRVEKIQKTLVEKGKEYRRGNDPLHNFNVAARLGNTTREKALWGFALKHYVSFMDILNDVEISVCKFRIKDRYHNQKINEFPKNCFASILRNFQCTA